MKLTQAEVIEELLNGFFQANGLTAVAHVVNGFVSYSMGNRDFCYPVNIKVENAQAVFYFFIGGAKGGPFSIMTNHLTSDPEAARKAVVKMFEEVSTWQVGRMIHDDVKFKYVNSLAAGAPTKANPSKPALLSSPNLAPKPVPLALERPRRVNV